METLQAGLKAVDFYSSFSVGRLNLKANEATPKVIEPA